MNNNRSVDKMFESARNVFAGDTENCIEASAMRRYAWGQLPEAEHEEISMHMLLCSKCRELYRVSRVADLQSIKSGVDSGLEEAGRLWDDVKAWLRDSIVSKPELGATPAGTGTDVTHIRAEVINAQTDDLDQRLELPIDRHQLPRIRSGRLKFSLELDDGRYDGWIAHLLVVSDVARLKLGEALIDLQRVEFDIEVSDLIGQREVLPADKLLVAISKNN